MAILSFSHKYKFLHMDAECNIQYEGEKFWSASHAYNWTRFEDEGLRAWVRNMPSAYQATSLTKNVPTTTRGWHDKKDEILEEILRIKFTDPKMKKKLLDTGDEDLIFGNCEGDLVFGARYHNFRVMSGQNKLGNLLMKLRAEFKNDSVTE